MKKIILILILTILCACDVSAKSRWEEGSQVIVKKGETVVYKTPCGIANIINPLNVQRGGGVLSGGADVEVLNTITVTYTNKQNNYWYYNKPSLVETVKNFPMNDYELEFYKEGCYVEVFITERLIMIVIGSIGLALVATVMAVTNPDIYRTDEEKKELKNGKEV